jgi:hypothetical protein
LERGKFVVLGRVIRVEEDDWEFLGFSALAGVNGPRETPMMRAREMRV